jgi:putative restriction endonuclease
MYPDNVGLLANLHVGQLFENRQALVDADVHREPQKGIWGAPSVGAYSIVLSGGYPDDVVDGDHIRYTGEGGQDPSTRVQVRNQTFEAQGNAALLRSCNMALPVRVVRKVEHGFRYEGLYIVDDAYHGRGQAGFQMCFFELRRAEVDPGMGAPSVGPSPSPPPRRQSLVTRVVRSTPVAEGVKRMHEYRCQVCGEALAIPPNSFYSEAAHIRPLGGEHRGLDVVENVLCLCPNHHVLFDRGAFSVRVDLEIVGALNGRLRTVPGHEIGQDYLEHHRRRFGFAT